MIEDYVHEFTYGPMQRISPLLALPKPGHDSKAITDISQIRIVADSQLAKTAIQREHRVTLTPEELAIEANGSDLLASMDLIEIIAKWNWLRNIVI